MQSVFYNKEDHDAVNFYLSSSGSGTVAIRGAHNESCPSESPSLRLDPLFCLDVAEGNGWGEADLGVIVPTYDAGEAGTGPIVGEYMTAPLLPIGTTVDITITGDAAGGGCPYW